MLWDVAVEALCWITGAHNARAQGTKDAVVAEEMVNDGDYTRVVTDTPERGVKRRQVRHMPRLSVLSCTAGCAVCVSNLSVNGQKLLTLLL